MLTADDLRARLAAPLAHRYLIERELGRGGMATVFLAQDLKLGRPVAIKVLHPELTTSLGSERFLREIRTTARLVHHNILTMHDSGEADGLLYYIMPFVQGESLRDLLKRESPLAVSEAVRIARQIADALAFAHTHGVVHRDIKPDNILLPSRQHACLADFGLARALSSAANTSLTASGLAVGSPHYMSPEQASGRSDVDARGDIYSLGCVLFEMMIGAPPFQGPTLHAIVVKHIAEPPPAVRAQRADVPVWLDRVIAKTMAKDPDDRFASAEELAAALDSIHTGGIGHQDTSRRARPRAGVSPSEVAYEQGKVVRPTQRFRTYAVIAIAALMLLALIIPAVKLVTGTSGWPVFSALADRRFRTADLDSTLYVVFPFNYATDAGEPLYEQQVIAEALGGWEGISLVNQIQVRDALARAQTPLSLPQARELARLLKAGRFFMGRVDRVREGRQSTIVVYDTQKGTQTGIEVRRISDPANADSLLADAVDKLVFGPSRSPRLASFRGTNSRPARLALQSGIEAVEQWDLTAADSLFFQALERDPQFASAALWLAQVRSWTPRAPAEWRFAAQRAVANRSRLSAQDAIFAQALLELARGDFPTACALYRRVAQAEGNDFVAWYSLGNCLFRDNAIVVDAHGRPSFRSGYHSAAQAYVHAFQLLTSGHKGWSSDLFSILRRVLITSEAFVRRGHIVDSQTIEFASYPSLAGDTLAFLPHPLSAFRSAQAEVIPVTRHAAVTRQRELFMEVARTWTSAFPSSAEAHLAMAVALDLREDPAAVDTLRTAIQFARDPGLREYLTALEVILRTKAAIPDNRASLRIAARLADSLQRANPAGAEHNPEIMAAIAALTGHVSRAAMYYERAVDPRSDLGSTLRAAHRLLVFATFGTPADSVRALANQIRNDADRLLTDVATRERWKAEWLTRAATLAYPVVHTDLGANASADYLAIAQAAAFLGDSERALQGLRDLIEARRGFPLSAITLDGVYPEAALFAELGDTATAINWIDGPMSQLRSVSPADLDDPIRAAALMQAIALRARLAIATGDVANARRWSNVVETLRQRADPLVAKSIARQN